ncbi:hypothetical protein SJAV_22890 [Sulfurisphaera javensis]|uniref:Uncharacterized protein n=2 Tax=Sulfurisphaera javensis TaxID=2049879 RepID=A0AAT9GTX6_9CREN
MRWLKKREIVIYYLLYKKFKYNEFNIGLAIDLLSPYFSKKTIKNTIKYMTKIGIINKLNETEYRLIPFEDYLSTISFQYLKRRATLRRKIQ